MSVYGSRLYSTLYCIFQHITVFAGFGAFCVHPEGHGLFEAGHNTAALPVEIYCSSRRCRSILFLTRPVLGTRQACIMSSRWLCSGEQGAQLILMMLAPGGAHHEHQVVRPGMAEKLRETTATSRAGDTRRPIRGCS